MSSGELAVISQPGDQRVLTSHNVSMIQARSSYWLQSATVPAAVGHQHHHVRDIIECHEVSLIVQVLLRHCGADGRHRLGRGRHLDHSRH